MLVSNVSNYLQADISCQPTTVQLSATPPLWEHLISLKFSYLKPGTHYPHVRWAHIKHVLFSTTSLSLPIRWPSYADIYNLVTWFHTKLPVGALFQLELPPFLESTCNVWRAIDTYVTSHEMCDTAEVWEACDHVSRPELHAKSRDVSRVTEVWIYAI